MTVMTGITKMTGITRNTVRIGMTRILGLG